MYKCKEDFIFKVCPASECSWKFFSGFHNYFRFGFCFIFSKLVFRSWVGNLKKPSANLSLMFKVYTHLCFCQELWEDLPTEPRASRPVSTPVSLAWSWPSLVDQFYTGFLLALQCTKHTKTFIMFRFGESSRYSLVNIHYSFQKCVS